MCGCVCVRAGARAIHVLASRLAEMLRVCLPVLACEKKGVFACPCEKMCEEHGKKCAKMHMCVCDYSGLLLVLLQRCVFACPCLRVEKCARILLKCCVFACPCLCGMRGACEKMCDYSGACAIHVFAFRLAEVLRVCLPV